MDMSFSLEDATALTPSPLGYPALLAALKSREAAPCGDRGDMDAPGRPALACLTDVILGRAGWQDAARVLGNRFAAPEPCTPASTIMTDAFTIRFQPSLHAAALHPAQGLNTGGPYVGGEAGRSRGYV